MADASAEIRKVGSPCTRNATADFITMIHTPKLVDNFDLDHTGKTSKLPNFSRYFFA